MPEENIDVRMSVFFLEGVTTTAINANGCATRRPHGQLQMIVSVQHYEETRARKGNIADQHDTPLAPRLCCAAAVALNATAWSSRPRRNAPPLRLVRSPLVVRALAFAQLIPVCCVLNPKPRV